MTDFMPPRDEHSSLVRIVRGVRGEVAMRMDLAIRFDYGRTIPWVTSTDGELRAVAGGDMVVLRTKAPLRGEGMTTVSDFTVESARDGDLYADELSRRSRKCPAEIPPAKALAETQRLWTEWAQRSAYNGPYKEAVERSLITLKALTYRPSGGIVAAVTTSLPEKIGGHAQLGLSLLLAARHGVHADGADAGGLRGGGDCVADVAAAGDCRRAGPGADHLRDLGRAADRGVGGGVAARL